MSEPPPASAKSCCTPARGGTSSLGVMPTQGASRGFDTCDIPGGTAIVGTDRPYLPDDGEGPLRRKKLKPFRIGRTTVTNAQFQIFVEETGYITEAERFGWSFVFWSDVSKDIPASYAVEGVEWWRRIDGATWRDITGPGTMEAVWHPDHPVVHVSHSDASAYAAWAGGRLPSEAEWEHAARGGLGHVTYPWGEEDPNDGDYFPCNIWQGDFPRKNTAADGWVTTAPAQSFEANGYGLYNMVGNVWQWTAEPFRVKSLKKQVRARLKEMEGYKLLKGGSFLCHRSYCFRYRIAARTGNSPDSTTTHTGFRVVWDAAPA